MLQIGSILRGITAAFVTAVAGSGEGLTLVHWNPLRSMIWRARDLPLFYPPRQSDGRGVGFVE